MTTNRMPVGFIGHGNPLNVAMEERFAPWRAWGESLPVPRAILAVSAHWEAAPVTIGRTADHERLLYDFSGFPEWMHRLRYPAPGAPALADRVESLLTPHVAVARSDRPLDHGVWAPLIHLFPAADVPVLQISMPLTMSEEELFDLGRELSALRDEGVFVLGTGNVVHNLREANWSSDEPTDYAVEFDGWVAAALRRRDTTGLQAWLHEAPDPLRNHPSAEHFRPLLVVAGAAHGDPPRFPVEGFEHATIARRSVQFD